MVDTFSLISVADRERGRIYLTASGRMDSAGFVDGYIAEMESVGDPWRFNRLIDVTACRGHVEFDDFVRLGKYWAPLTSLAKAPLKTAVVTSNARTESRMPVISMLLDGHEIRTFRDMAEAEAWLDWI